MAQEEEDREREEQERQRERREQREALLKEYQELTATVRNRGLEHSTVQSILIAGSLLATMFAFEHLGENAYSFIALLIAIFLVIFAWVMHETTSKVDDVFWDRICKIEQDERVNIQIGHHGLFHDKIKDACWYSVRRNTWRAIFLTLILFYVATLIFYIAKHLN